MGATISFVLPSLPISANRAHNIDFRRRRVYLSDAARRWKSDMQLLIPRFKIADTSMLQVDYVAYYPFFHANGRMRKVDTSNLQELLHNTIALRIGIDDSFIKKGSFDSRDSEDAKVRVTLTEIPEDVWRSNED